MTPEPGSVKIHICRHAMTSFERADVPACGMCSELFQRSNVFFRLEDRAIQTERPGKIVRSIAAFMTDLHLEAERVQPHEARLAGHETAVPVSPALMSFNS